MTSEPEKRPKYAFRKAVTTMAATMVFGDGTYRNRARQQFMQLAGDEKETIPLVVLNEKLRARRGELDMSDAQIEAFLRQADKNNDMSIDMLEFEILMASPLGKSNRMRFAMRTLADGVIAKNQRLEVHSYLDEYNCLPPPLFVFLISIAQIATFFYYYFQEDPMGDIMTECAGCFIHRKPGPLMFVPKLRADVWRFFTYQFLHAGIPHLLGNMIMQLLIGVPLEIVHKLWRIGPLYILAVISGALLQYSLDPTVSLVGASAGVYALITAHLANVFLNWNEMPFRWVRLAVVGVFLSFDVGGTVYRRLFAGECDTISHSAHIAGGITGFCFGVFILHNVVKQTWEKVVRIICLVAYAIFLIGIILMAILQLPTAKPIWDNADCGANL